jgi:serine/threonine protein kinase
LGAPWGARGHAGREMQKKTPQIGDIIAGRYELVEQLGKGAFGSVFRARQLGIDRMVAIKLLLPDAESVDATAVSRFEREAKLSSSLEHPNTITIHDYGEWEGILYLVMEYVRGRSLQQLLRKDGAMDPERAVHILRQVLASLQEAHSRGIIHRDMKPGNIMLFDRVGQKDVVKVLDFGIARFVSNDDKHNDPEAVKQDLTVSGRIVGTPRYMSPEQVRGVGTCAASDIYSVGLIFYEMLTGRQAVSGDSTLSLIALQLSPDQVIDPDDEKIPDLLAPLLLKSTAKDLPGRYDGAQAFLNDLNKLEKHFGALNAIPPKIPELPPDVAMDEVFEESPRRGGGVSVGLVAGGALLLLLLLVGGGAILYTQLNPAPTPPPAPEVARADAPPAEPPAIKAPSVVDPPPVVVKEAPPDEAPPVVEAPPARLVEVVSTPPGATVLRGDEALGVTPLKVAISPDGPQELALRRKGYLDARLSLDKDSADQLKVQLKRQEARANPADANPNPTDPPKTPKYKPF